MNVIFCNYKLTGVFWSKIISLSWDLLLFGQVTFLYLATLGARHLKAGCFDDFFQSPRFSMGQSFVWWDGAIQIFMNHTWTLSKLDFCTMSAESTELKWQKLFCRRRQRRASTYINNRQIGFDPVFPAFNDVFHPPWPLPEMRVIHSRTRNNKVFLAYLPISVNRSGNKRNDCGGTGGANLIEEPFRHTVILMYLCLPKNHPLSCALLQVTEY